MWVDNEISAIKIGLDYETYWTEPPRYFNKRLKAWEEQLNSDAQSDDVSNYNLGIYMSYAFNSPKKYPKKPFLSKGNEKKRMDWKDLESTFRALSKNNKIKKKITN